MKIDAKTKVCGLIGYPVGHSISPVIHNDLAALYGHNLVYVPLAVSPGNLKKAIDGAEAFDFLGMNVTVPYKSETLPYLKEIDPLAKRIGAVNTLVRTEGGYKGYNTDMPGLYRAMRADGVKIAGEEVILLGAGGAARAVAFMLLEKGAKRIIILNRSIERALKLTEEVNQAAKEQYATAYDLDEYGKLDQEQKYLVIQATNVGMFPHTEQAVIEDEDFYKLVKTGYDIIFNPPETRFMHLVKKSGGEAFNGLKMLLYQGIIAYELWNHVSVSEEAAQDIYQNMQTALAQNR